MIYSKLYADTLNESYNYDGWMKYQVMFVLEILRYGGCWLDMNIDHQRMRLHNHHFIVLRLRSMFFMNN